MNQDTTNALRASIRESLQAFSVSSYVFQSAVATRAGLHPTDLHGISWLSFRPQGATASELGSELGLTSGATTTAIDRLVSLSFVERTEDLDDRRRVRVRLRQDGVAVLAQEYGLIDRGVDVVLANLSTNEAATVARFLKALRNVPAAEHNDQSM